MRIETRIAVLTLTLALAAGLARGADSAPQPKQAAVEYTRIDKPYELIDYSWVPRALKKAPDLKSDKPHYTLMVIGTGEEMKKSVMAMILDESEGPGKGYDVLYADRNFNGDLTEPDERLTVNADSWRQPKTFIAFKVKDAEGKREYEFFIKLNSKAGVLGEWPSSYTVPGLYSVGALPGNVTLTCSGDLQTAPVYRLGGPLCQFLNGRQPGSLLGTNQAGNVLAFGMHCSVPGDTWKAQLVAASTLPTDLRVLGKDGKTIEEIPIGGRCACGGGYMGELQIPGRVPPGVHEVVSRDEKSHVEFVYKVQIENPDYGKPLDDPGYADLKAKFPKAKFAMLRKAANVPAELLKAYPDENVVPFGIRHVVPVCNNLEGDHRGDAVIDNPAYLVLGLGQHPKDGDMKSCLMKFDLSAIPKETRILGVQLRLVLMQGGFAHTAKGVKLAAWPLRREWYDKAQTNGYTCWYGPLISARDGSKGIQWGKPGCNDPETDYVAALETSTDAGGFPEKATQETRRVVSLDLSTIVQKWRSGEIPDNGLVLKIQGGPMDIAHGAGGALDIASSHHAEAIYRPTLVIAYEGPDPAPQFAPVKAATCPAQ
jgi:hypothetical protein